MSVTSSENILRVLMAFNSWWSTGVMPQQFLLGNAEKHGYKGFNERPQP